MNRFLRQAARFFLHPWVVAIWICVALLWASRAAPAGAELSAAEAEQREQAAYLKGLTDGAREATKDSECFMNWQAHPRKRS